MTDCRLTDRQTDDRQRRIDEMTKLVSSMVRTTQMTNEIYIQGGNVWGAAQASSRWRQLGAGKRFAGYMLNK